MAWDRRRSLCIGLGLEQAAVPGKRSILWDFLSPLPKQSRPHLVCGGATFATEANMLAAAELGTGFVFDLSANPIVAGMLRGFRFEEDPSGAGGFAWGELFIHLAEWGRPRRVLFLREPGKRIALAVSGGIPPAEIRDAIRCRGRPPAEFCGPSSIRIPRGRMVRRQSHTPLEEAEQAAVLHNLARRHGAIPPIRIGPRRCGRGLFATLFPVVIAILLATGLAFTANPTDSQAPPPPPETPVESDADFLLAPMQPAEPDAGFQAIQAETNYPIAPIPDPNVDDVPPLDGEQIGLVEIPQEASDRVWRIRPIIATGLTYDDNIFISNTDRKGDLIYNINLGFALEVGDYRNMEGNFLLLEYVAEGFFFNRYASQNSFDQQASLLAQYRFNQLAVQVESRYQYLTGAEREVGSFTTRSLYFNALRFLYTYSGKTGIDLEFNQSTNDYPSNLSSSNYQASLGFDYALFPKTRAGLQAIAGLQPTEDSPDMWYQTINARVRHGATGKVALNATGGIQFNQYEGGGEPMRILPVFSLGAEYQLFPKTSLSLVGYRNLQSSASIAGQDYIATGGEFGVSQGLADKLSFAIATGYENDTYVANTADTDATRVDNFYFFRPSVTYSFLKYVRTSLSYEYRANASTFQQDSWFDNQFSWEFAGEF
jgi:hypothetical protein